MKKNSPINPFFKGDENKKISHLGISSLKSKGRGLQGFTLVELIVVITILAILGTIAFISLQGYSRDARNATRTSDMANIQKVLVLYQTTNGEFPEPTNPEQVTYSGSEVWTQGTFGEDTRRKLGSKGNISYVPLDPLTGNQYTYSVLNTGQEMQLAGVYEGDIALNTTNTTYAAGEYGTTKIIGNYNGKVAKTGNCNSLTVLAVPSIVASDLSDPSLETILTNKELLYNGFKGLPASYSGTTKFMSLANDDKKIFVNAGRAEVFTGTCNSLSNESVQTTFIENLQQAYTGTVIKDEPNIEPIINPSNPEYTAQTIIHNFVTPTIKIIAHSNTGATNNGGASNPHIAANGVTITCDGMNPGDTFDVNGKTYTVVDNQMLEDKIGSNDTAFYESACTSLVTSFNYGHHRWTDGIFYNANINPDISHWDTSNVINMVGTFAKAISFNQNINNWNTSKVTDMSSMFASATSFNQNINNWDTSNVTNMYGMFSGASSFNQPLDNWNTSNVTNMVVMFSYASSFNGSLDNWDTSNVTSMNSMFASATSFNQNINNWDTSKTRGMIQMFENASSFNQPLDNWDTSNVTSMNSMFHNASAFNKNINNWDISNVTNMRDMFSYASSFNQPLDNWNTSNVTNMWGVFSGASSFNKNINNWDTSNVTNMYYMFFRASNFNQLLDNWDVSSVTNMGYMFRGASSFNQSLNNWDVSSVTNMGYMFRGASSFNQPLNNWDTSKVTNMYGMFNGATSFNQPLNNWDVSNVTDMGYMFYYTDDFNQPLNNWNTSNVTNMMRMFSHASSFDQDISGWNVDNVSNHYNFDNATSGDWEAAEKPSFP